MTQSSQPDSAKRMRVTPNEEQLAASRGAGSNGYALVAVLGQTTYEPCGLANIAHCAEFVAGMPGQEKWKKTLLNRGKRAERLQVSDATAVAFGFEPADCLNALVRNEDVAQLSPIALSAFHNIAIRDHAAA